MLSPDASSFASAGFALVGLLYLAFGAYLRLSRQVRAPGDRWGGRLFVLALLATGAWGLASVVDGWSIKRFTWHLAWGLDQARLALWAAFLLVLMAPADRLDAPLGHRRGWWLGAALLALGLGVNIATGLVPEDHPLSVPAIAMVSLCWAVYSLLLVEQVFRNQVDAARWAAKPLCLALAGASVFDIYLFAQVLMVGTLDSDVLAARSLVQCVAWPLLLLATRRQVHWVGQLKVSTSAAFYSASLLLVGLYLLFVSAAGYYVRYVGGSWGGALQVSLVFAALVFLSVVMMSGEMRARVRVFIGKNFFHYRYDYRVEWLKFTAMLSTKGSPQELGQLVVRGLADMVESPAGALWFKALGDAQHVPAAVWNLTLNPATDAEPPDSPFCRFLAEREWIFELGQPSGHDRGAGTAVPEADAVVPAWLKAVPDLWAVVPLIVGDELIGFVALARPRAKQELNWEVRDLLKTAARQAAGFLAQMHATEALLEARKFDAFNRMSAFVVHDLKNIVTQLSLMLKNAQRHAHNPEFQQDMLATVESSLDKMRQMMLQLREGAKPAGPASGVDLVAVLKRIQAAAQQRGRNVALTLPSHLATRGHEERIERVIGHVVQNALDATPVSGNVWVQLQQNAGRAVVEVGDTGSGMTAEFIQNRLFRPFNSTKSSGMGIGTYESFQYLRELGGSIDVKSELGQGTVVTMHLPLFEVRTTSDLQPAIGA